MMSHCGRAISTLKYCGTIALVALAMQQEARAQVAQTMSAHMRDVMADVATASALPRLDSTMLASGVRREIRIYTGFGMGSPDRVVRIWQDGRDAYGRFGVFWPTGLPRSAASAEWERARLEDVRESRARLSAYVDSLYDCRATTQSRLTHVCWLDQQPDRVVWEDVVARLDSIGVESIQMPADPKIGFDGWMIAVEVRTSNGYHAYTFWVPDSKSAEPGERAAAMVAEVIRGAFSRRLER